MCEKSRKRDTYTTVETLNIVHGQVARTCTRFLSFNLPPICACATLHTALRVNTGTVAVTSTVVRFTFVNV